ncbi:hypothetical protein RclHR1_15500005 [Rhizophagus clarus]|uniref:Uncharacterized protein n=1 Tax=Rhizophagus clarus TaxID=94130 RepID=A0A2Z6R7X6_9GLOM|nr:hypothetical protein RclHR1_15500005 [Rhizophagus clarus]
MLLQTTSSADDEYKSFWYYNLQEEKQCKTHCILIIIFLSTVFFLTLLCAYSIYNENKVVFNDGFIYLYECCGFYWFKNKIFKSENKFGYSNLNLENSPL